MSQPQSERRNRLPEEWWDCATECFGTCAMCMTKWPMARRHSRRDLARHFTDHQFPLETLSEYIPITSKNKQFGKKTMNGICSGLCATCGRRLVRRLDGRRLREICKYQKRQTIYVKRFEKTKKYSQQDNTNLRVQTEH